MTEQSEQANTEKKQSVWQKAEHAFENKRASKFLDPCQEASNRSIKCLQRNDGDRDMCEDYFKAYRECKKEWMNERKYKYLKNSN